MNRFSATPLQRRARMTALSLLAATALSACASLPPASPARVAKAPASYATAQSLAGPSRDWPLHEPVQRRIAFDRHPNQQPAVLSGDIEPVTYTFNTTAP